MNKKWTVEYSANLLQYNNKRKLNVPPLLEVDFSKNYIRKSSHLSDTIITKTKNDLGKLIVGSRDLPKYRLKGVEVNSDRLLMKIGLTSYFDYLTTNYHLGTNKRLRNLGLQIEQDVDAYLANAIGNLAIIETLNNKLVLLRRSTSVSTFKDQWDAPGGHPEPTPACMEGHQKPERVNAIIRDELFNSIEHEIQEEIGVERSYLNSIYLLRRKIIQNRCGKKNILRNTLFTLKRY